MTTAARPQTSDEWLAEAEKVEAWADELRAELDARQPRTTKFEWESWQMLHEAGARFRGIAAEFYALEVMKAAQ